MKVIKSAFIIIGSIIGAGFASGKEIYEYFAKFGTISLLFIIPLFILFYVFIRIYLSVGKKHNNIKVNVLNNHLCRKINLFNKSLSYLNIFMFTTFLILCSAMFSGLIALIETYFGDVDKIFSYIIVILISLFMLKLSPKSIELFSFIVVPLIIICISICAIYSINSLTLPTQINFNGLIGLPPLTLAYSAQNTFLASIVIINLGKTLSAKEQKRVSLIVSVSLCLLITVGILCFLLNPYLSDFDMPFAEISKALNPYFSILFGFVILFSILTTYSTSITSLREYFDGNKKYNKPYSLLGLIILLSLLNFGTIIEYMYPLIGIFGVVYCYKCLSYSQLPSTRIYSKR